MATCVSPDPSFHRLLTCLEQIRSKLDNKQDNFFFLYDYFRQPEFKGRSSVLSTGGTISANNSNSALSLAQQVCDVLVLYSDTNEQARELHKLLLVPHFKGLLQAHDDVVKGQCVYKELLEKQMNNIYADDGGFPSEEDKLWSQNMEVQIKQQLWDCQAAQEDNCGLPELEESQTVCDDEEGILTAPGEGALPVTLVKEPLDPEEGVFPVTSFKEPLNPEEGVLPVALNEPLNQGVLPVTPLKEPWEPEEEVSGQSKETFPVNETASNSHMKVIEGVAGDNVDPGNRTIKVLKLRKSDSQSLGVTVRSDEEQCAIVVARILHGGTADKCGLLKVGDEIMEINDRNVAGLSTDEVVDIIDRISGSVSLKVASPVAEAPEIKYEVDKVYMRALFDFDPMRDPLIPCMEAGVPFKKGDILQVVSQEDMNWWQAQRADNPNGEVGLIPSKEFQQTRRAFDRRVSGSTSPSADDSLNNDTAADEVKLISPYAKWKRRKSASNKGTKSRSKSAKKGETPTYEEVTLYRASQNKNRPVLLIGPSGVGRTELKRMLLMNEPDTFVATVPHTSRPMQPYETDGKDYHFVSRHTMERFIQDNKFIEVGEYKGCLYGTSKDSIKRAMKTGKICVIKVHEEPPSLGRLRNTRHISTKANSAANKRGDRSFKEEDLQKVISTAEAMERDYGHLFDLTVVNDDLQETYKLLVAALNRVANEQQWVPISWLQSQ